MSRAVAGRSSPVRQNGRSRPDRADRRHVNVTRGERDERAGRSGVGVDEGVGRDGGVIEELGDFLRGIEPAAVSVHFENDRGGARGLRRFLHPPQEQEHRRIEISPCSGTSNDVALVNIIPRLQRE